MSNRLKSALRSIRGSKGRRRAPITLAYSDNDPDALRGLAGTQLSHSAVVVPVEVPDPMEGDKTVLVFRSVRDDLLGELYSRSLIHSEHYRAGREWQRTFESAGLGHISAIDTTREAVDGGVLADPLTDSQMRASDKLKRLNTALGRKGEKLVFYVLGRGLSVRTMLEIYGLPKTRRSHDYLYDRLRECLDTLMEELGYVLKKRA